MFYPDAKFINTLSEKEKFIFLKIICGMVASDRKVSHEELVYLREVALKYGVSGDKLSAMIKSADKDILMKQARLIEDRSKALSLIKDMCMVANLDTDLSDAEIDYILDVSEALGIEAQRVRDINAVVNEYLAVSQKASLLLEQEYWS